MYRLASILGFALAIFSLAPAANADTFTEFDFTANNTTNLFGGGPGSFNLFGVFTIDDTTGSTYTSDFWVQQVGAGNGEFTTSSGMFSTIYLHTGGTVAGNTFEIQGFDVTNNNILLTFQTDLFSVTPGAVDPLTQVNFDNGVSVDNSPVGGVCVIGTCPSTVGGDAPLSPNAPEPASLALFGGGLLVLGWLRRHSARS